MLTETLRVGLMTALITVSRCASDGFVFASSVRTSLALECQRRFERLWRASSFLFFSFFSLKEALRAGVTWLTWLIKLLDKKKIIKTVEDVLEKKRKRKAVCCPSHLLFEDDRETLAMQTPPPISGTIIFLACEKCKIYCTQVTIKTVKPPRLFERVLLFHRLLLLVVAWKLCYSFNMYKSNGMKFIYLCRNISVVD